MGGGDNCYAESYLTFSLFTITYNFATLVKSEE